MKLRIGMRVVLTLPARDMFVLNDKPGELDKVEHWIGRVGVVMEEYHHGGGKLYRINFDSKVDGRSVWVIPGLCMKPTGREVNKTAGMIAEPARRADDEEDD